MSKNLIKLLRRVIRIMSSSKGRDKICGVVQYISKIIALSASESNIESIKRKFESKQMKLHLFAFRT